MGHRGINYTRQDRGREDKEIIKESVPISPLISHSRTVECRLSKLSKSLIIRTRGLKVRSGVESIAGLNSESRILNQYWS